MGSCVRTSNMGRRKVSDEVFEDGDKVPRNAANARERTRMRVLSKAFGRLKLTLPWVPPDTKLSKLDTLRLAMSYINHLQRTLEEDDNNLSENKEIDVPIKNKKCWPYRNPGGSIDSRTDSAKQMMSTYCMRLDENMREDNYNVDMWFSEGGASRDKKVSDFMEDCESF